METNTANSTNNQKNIPNILVEINHRVTGDQVRLDEFGVRGSEGQ
jgi:hypothetical protein